MIGEQTSRPSTENRMSKNKIQFIKDGLVGVAAAGLMYVPITLATFFLSPTRSLGETSLYTGLYFMPPVCLIMFISVGSNVRFIENITTRKNWGKPILKMAGVSGLVAFFVILIGLYVKSSIDKVSEAYPHHNFDSIYQALFVYSGAFYDTVSSFFLGSNGIFSTLLIFIFIVGGAISTLLAFVIAYLFAMIFNPQKRLLIPVVTSLSVIISMPIGWYLGFLLYVSIFGFEMGLHHLPWSAL
ncbi:MAG: hypothetical protein WA821_07905 [Anaerolineales bacterium]